VQSRLNIADVPMMAAAPAQAAPAAAPAAAAAADAEPAAEKPKEKQAFKVTLKAIDAAQKAKAIKEVKAAIAGMNLVEAKKFVESAPQVIKESMPKEDAEKLQKALQAVGATVELE
jgi:large subunit ribosomal protein L7/L12